MPLPVLFPKRSLRAYARIWTYCFADHLLSRRRQFRARNSRRRQRLRPAFARRVGIPEELLWASDVQRQCFSSCSTCGCRTRRRCGHRFRILPSRSSEPGTERHSPATMNRRNPWVVPFRFDVARTVASGHQSTLCLGDTRLHPELVYRRHRGAQSRSVRFRRTQALISQCSVGDGVDIGSSTLLCHRQFRIIAKVGGRRCRTTGTVAAPLRRRADRCQSADHAWQQPDRRGISPC